MDDFQFLLQKQKQISIEKLTYRVTHLKWDKALFSKSEQKYQLFASGTAMSYMIHVTNPSLACWNVGGVGQLNKMTPITNTALAQFTHLTNTR